MASYVKCDYWVILWPLGWLADDWLWAPLLNTYTKTSKQAVIAKTTVKVTEMKRKLWKCTRLYLMHTRPEAQHIRGNCLQAVLNQIDYLSAGKCCRRNYIKTFLPYASSAISLFHLLWKFPPQHRWACFQSLGLMLSLKFPHISYDIKGAYSIIWHYGTMWIGL